MSHKPLKIERFWRHNILSSFAVIIVYLTSLLWYLWWNSFIRRQLPLTLNQEASQLRYNVSRSLFIGSLYRCCVIVAGILLSSYRIGIHSRVCSLNSEKCDFYCRLKNTSAKSKARGKDSPSLAVTFPVPWRVSQSSRVVVVVVMVNKCVMGCASKQQQQQDDEKPCASDVHAVRNFHFPIKRNTHLLTHWERFVNKDATWKATQHTVLCSNHFEKKFIVSNERDANLDWKADPIPTIYMDDKYKQHPSLIPTPVRIRKPPTKRNFQEDQLPAFLKQVYT